jgi:hypothetical protein
MHLLPFLVGVGMISVNMLIQPLNAEVSTEAPPTVQPLCGGKIDDIYCRCSNVLDQIILDSLHIFNTFRKATEVVLSEKE